MRIVHATDIPLRKVSKHREKSPLFRRLLQGERGTLGNYEFTHVVVEDDYFTPRHRHNFDQVRIMLKGEFDYGDGVQTAGTIGYFPAGTYYTQQATSSSLTLLLQIGAACRQGYLDFGQVEQTAEALSQKGDFEKGVYSWKDSDGKIHRQDGYEAIFSEAMGFKPKYPNPRFLNAVVMDPRPVAALADKANGGTIRKLGQFNEFGLRFAIREAQAGDNITLTSQSGQSAILYCNSGSGQLQEGTNVEEGTAMELATGESTSLTAKTAISLIQIDLPNFEQD